MKGDPTPARRAAMAAAAEGADIVVVGGGATGLGTAVDAATRGYRTVLLEANDFAHATSSRSTKLVHGGVRYLRQGNLKLVLGALRERARILSNAPHLAHEMGFVIPAYRWWEKPYYGTGLKLYDLLARGRGLTPSHAMGKDATLARLPTLRPAGLRGGIAYADGQFDDAQLAVALAQTAAAHGATVLNHCRVTGFEKSGGRITGVRARDEETGAAFTCAAKVVVNATGIFTDEARALDNPDRRPLLTVSRGSHIVLPRAFLPGDCALMVPKTRDGRVLFAVPWHHRVIVGTTDVQAGSPELDPTPTAAEIDFILETAAGYLDRPPRRPDITAVFAGLRPLVRPPNAKDTKAISRDHTLVVDPSGLVTIAGGKWTTYRQMAEDTIARAAKTAGLPPRPCRTATLKLAGAEDTPEPPGGDPNKTLHPDLADTTADVVRAARHGFARSVDDVLARRTRALILDAHAALDIAPTVAQILARELGHSPAWADRSAAAFATIAQAYLPPP